MTPRRRHQILDQFGDSKADVWSTCDECVYKFTNRSSVGKAHFFFSSVVCANGSCGPVIDSSSHIMEESVVRGIDFAVDAVAICVQPCCLKTRSRHISHVIVMKS